MHWQHLNTRASCAMYFQFRWLQPMIKQAAPDDKKVANQAKRVKDTLDAIENIWLDGGKNKYIAGGDKISVADIQACCELEQPGAAG